MQQIIKDEIHVDIFSYPPVMERPFRAWIRLQTPASPMQDADTAADFDSESGTTSVDAAEGTTTLRFSSSVDYTPGSLYFVKPDTGQAFAVKALAFNSISPGIFDLTIADPLPMPVPSGSVVGGYRVSFAMSAENVSQQGRCIARWKFQVRDGLDVIDHIWDEPFLIVNAQTNYQLTSSELVRIYPMADRLRPPTDEDLTELIETGWSNYVRPDLEGKGLKANQIKSWERLTPAHAAACVYHLVLTDERQSQEYREQWRNVYAHQMDLMFASVRFWYSETDSTQPGDSDRNFMGRSISR